MLVRGLKDIWTKPTINLLAAIFLCDQEQIEFQKHVSQTKVNKAVCFHNYHFHWWQYWDKIVCPCLYFPGVSAKLQFQAKHLTRFLFYKTGSYVVLLSILLQLINGCIFFNYIAKETEHSLLRFCIILYWHVNWYQDSK